MRLTDRKQANSHQGWGVGGIKGKKKTEKTHGHGQQCDDSWREVEEGVGRQMVMDGELG